MNCARCQDIRWIREEHPDKPLEHDGCKGSGMPCSDCNPSAAPRCRPCRRTLRLIGASRSRPDNEHDEATNEGGLERELTALDGLCLLAPVEQPAGCLSVSRAPRCPTG